MQTVEGFAPPPGWLTAFDDNRTVGYIVAMLKGEPFTVDLADPASLKESLTVAAGKVEEYREKMRDAYEGLARWETLYQRLAGLVDPGDLPAAGESTRERIYRILAESQHPISITGVAQMIPNVKRKTISWTLWDMEKKKEIRRVTDGLYARLDWEPSQTLLND